MERNRQAIASNILGHIDWTTWDRGFIKCPGENFHTGNTGKRDCRIIISDAPTIYCFHSSCSHEVEEANLRLRKAIGGGEFVKRELTEIEKLEFKEKQKKKKMEFDLQLLGSMKKEVILDKFQRDPCDYWEDSPIRLDDGPENDAKLFINLFKDDDVIWNGPVMASGCPINRFNFKKVWDWRNDMIEGNFTCPSTFKPETFSRSNENVMERRFLVIESDTLNQNDICAVFNFCSKFMNLRAIVYTGGKSLHGWFDFPSSLVFDSLKQILPPLGCDDALFKMSQPVRMPGVPRGTKTQSLLYLKL